MEAVIIPGYGQDAESPLTNSIETQLSPEVSVTFAEAPSKEFYKEKYLENIMELQGSLILIGHSLGASLSLSLLNNKKIKGVAALDPIREIEDCEGNKLKLGQIDSDKPVLVISSSADHIELPKLECAAVNIDSGHFFEGRQKNVAKIIGEWVDNNVR